MEGTGHGARFVRAQRSAPSVSCCGYALGTGGGSPADLSSFGKKVWPTTKALHQPRQNDLSSADYPAELAQKGLGAKPGSERLIKYNTPRMLNATQMGGWP